MLMCPHHNPPLTAAIPRPRRVNCAANRHNPKPKTSNPKYIMLLPTCFFLLGLVLGVHYGIKIARRQFAKNSRERVAVRSRRWTRQDEQQQALSV
jgi:hypothetical protein